MESHWKMLDWSTLREKKSIELENFLLKANVGTVLNFMNSTVLTKILFNSLALYQKDSLLQARILELLQDYHLLSSNGLMNDDLENNYQILLTCLAEQINHVEVIVKLFELLAMISHLPTVFNSFGDSNDYSLVEFTLQAMKLHKEDTSLHRSGLQFINGVLRHLTEIQKFELNYFVLPYLLAALENFQDVEEINFFCYSALSYFSSLTGKIFAPFQDELLTLCMGSMKRNQSAEIVSKCVEILRNLTKDKSSLLVLAGYDDCLMTLAQTLKDLPTAYLPTAVSAFELLLRLLEDNSLTDKLLESVPPEEDVVAYLCAVKAILRVRVDEFLDGNKLANENTLHYFFTLYRYIHGLLVKKLAKFPSTKN